jgi:predicted Zn-dependent protease
MRRLIAVFGLAISISACASDDGPMDPGSIFAPSVTRVALEVDYQAGAEPITGMVQGTDTWSLFRANAQALFAGAPRDVDVPSTLNQMEQLSGISGDDFAVSDILEVADRHRDSSSSGDTVSFYVLYLDGFFADEVGRQADVLGVSIGNTGVIAIFKPVIESIQARRLGDVTRAFVEQSTLIHEFGHAVGLVNNGLPIVSQHHDAEHGAHCTNPDCVMYYLNEGASSLVNFVLDYVRTGEAVLFGAACLEDARAAAKQ